MKIVSEKQLQRIKRISDADKKLIEKIVKDLYQDNEPEINALRGYLVQLFDETVVDDKFRADIEVWAGAWADGWDDGKRNMMKWIRKFGVSCLVPIRGKEYDVYHVRKSELDKLEEA